MSVASAVLLSRLHRGMTADELGAEVGRDEAWVRQVEGGARTPAVEEIAAIARTLEWPVSLATRMAATVDDGVAALVGLQR